MSKITNDEIATLQSLYNQENNIALMRAKYEDRDIAVIVRFRESDNGAEATPVALLIDQEFFDRIVPPEDPYVGMESEDSRSDVSN